MEQGRFLSFHSRHRAPASRLFRRNQPWRLLVVLCWHSPFQRQFVHHGTNEHPLARSDHTAGRTLLSCRLGLAIFRTTHLTKHEWRFEIDADEQRKTGLRQTGFQPVGIPVAAVYYRRTRQQPVFRTIRGLKPGWSHLETRPEIRTGRMPSPLSQCLFIGKIECR